MVLVIPGPILIGSSRKNLNGDVASHRSASRLVPGTRGTAKAERFSSAKPALEHRCDAPVLPARVFFRNNDGLVPEASGDGQQSSPGFEFD